MTVFLMDAKQIAAFSFCDLPEILVEIKGVQQQTNSVDCGLFAIAFATSLAFGEDPANVTYDSKKLRMHLIKCLNKKQMTCFPKSTEKLVSKCQSRLAAIELYCKCWMPYNESSTKYEDRMVEFSSLKCKQKLRGFAGDKNSSRREVLICKFHQKLLKVIREKTKPIPEYAIHRSLI